MDVVAVAERQADFLESNFKLIDTFIGKNYLAQMNSYEVVSLSGNEDVSDICLFKLEQLTFDTEENIQAKLINVYTVLSELCDSLMLLIRGEETKTTVYLGVRAESKDLTTAGTALQKSFCGNFPGSKLIGLRGEDISSLMETVTGCDFSKKGVRVSDNNIASITLVPSMKEKSAETFVQGMEKYIDAMQGSTYTAIVLAQPISKAELHQRKKGLEELYSSASPLASVSLSYGVNSSISVTEGTCKNISQTISQSVSNALGTNSGTNHSSTQGSNSGSSWNFDGLGYNSGSHESETSGYSAGVSWTVSTVSGTTDTVSDGVNQSATNAEGESRTLTVQHQNKSIQELLDQITKQLERIKSCEAYGVWDVAAYFIAEEVDTAVIASNTYSALVVGENTSVENSYMNLWMPWESAAMKQRRDSILESLFFACHPKFLVPFSDKKTFQTITLGNLTSGSELPLVLGLPQASVCGVKVVNIAKFGRNPFEAEGNPITLGSVYHMGTKQDKNKVVLSLEKMTGHCFVCGSTGSGKSNTIYGLLRQAIDMRIPFLVIEPAKGEYKDVFAHTEGINVFTANPMIGMLLKINPFKFNENIHILEHLERLIEIFNVCWEMYAAMPAILKDAIEQAYIDIGWDLLNSIYIGEGFPKFPTFEDVLEKLPLVIKKSKYSSDVQSDYQGALITRVKSLTNGIAGQIFCDFYDVPEKSLFDECTIIDLSRIGSSETKALIMGILMLKLTEHRMAYQKNKNAPLSHITVLEEAHHLLKKTDVGATNSILSKSVEMICNNIAEMRTYGEGFVIVDQSPSSVENTAIKNTNTKIIMRLPDKNDCEIVGSALSLSSEQVSEIAKLETGIALIMQNNWNEAVLCAVDYFPNRESNPVIPVSFKHLRLVRSVVVKGLMRETVLSKKYDIFSVLDDVNRLPIDSFKKKDFVNCLRLTLPYILEEKNGTYSQRLLFDISGIRFLWESSIRELYEITPLKAKRWRANLLQKMKIYLDDNIVDLDLFFCCMLEFLSGKSCSIDYKRVQMCLESEND